MYCAKRARSGFAFHEPVGTGALAAAKSAHADEPRA
jgi:hypothetical protein